MCSSSLSCCKQCIDREDGTVIQAFYHSSKQDNVAMQQNIANLLLMYRSTTHPTTWLCTSKTLLRQRVMHH